MKSLRFRAFPILLVLAVVAAAPVVGSDDASRQEDEETKGKGLPFLPIPIFVTEPALGYGLGGAVLYFHEHPEGDAPSDMAPALTPGTTAEAGQGQQARPNITGIAAAWTEDGSSGVGGGHVHSWREDTIRYSGMAAYADLELTYYLFDLPLRFEIEGVALYQELLFRLGESKTFLGGKLAYLETDTLFRLRPGDTLPPELGPFDASDVGLALAMAFDGRDNTFTPNRGRLFEVDAWRYDEAFGGDFDYWKFNFRFLSFHQLGDRFVLGLRLDASMVQDDPPFYGYPWVSLRGIPAMRYQDDWAATAEVEGRWNIRPRWAVLGFLGKGEIGGETDAFETEDEIVAGGVGARYLFREDLGLWVGIDYAVGPEDETSYIQIGHAW
jgi:hypothetical protein